MASTDPLIGKKLGDYLIEAIQGAGGMARVYRGYDDKLDRYSAVKVIEPQLIASAEEEEYRERFLREARSIARLNHSRIVGVYQFGQIENLYYIAMEYVDGKNLREVLKTYIKDDRQMPVADMVRTLKDIAGALDYAHQQDIIHRDVKPSNIIITPDNSRAVLTDFGLALNAVEGTIGNTFGSVHYIAPEQAISSAQAVPRSDQYSLGIVAYEMLTGRVPFDDASAMSVALKHISDPPPPLRDINPEVPIEVEKAVMRALDKDVNRRFSSCTAFVNILEQAFEEAEINKQSDDAAAMLAAWESSGRPEPVTADDFPTITDTSSRPTSVPIEKPSEEESGEESAEQSAKSREKQASVREPSVKTEPDNKSNRSVLIAGAIIVVLVLIGAALILPGLLDSGEDDPVTVTTTAPEVVQISDSDATETAAVAIAETQTQQADDNAGLTASQTAASQSTETAMLSLQQTETADAELIETEEAAVTEPVVMATEDVVLETEDPAVTEPVVMATEDVVLETEDPAITEESPDDSDDLSTATPGVIMPEGEDAAEILLRYNGDTLVLYNRSNRSQDVASLEFYLFIPDENGDPIQRRRFRSSEWFGVNSAVDIQLEPRYCLQVWTLRFSELPQTEPPADVCRSRFRFRATVRPFWFVPETQADQVDNAYFEVRDGPTEVLTSCPVVIEDLDAPIIHCEVKLPVDYE